MVITLNYVYILKCKDESLYTGWTNDLEKRIKAHNNGCGAKYTRGRGPVKLVYFESFENKREAQSREYYIKKLTRNQKLQLISSKSIEEMCIRDRYAAASSFANSILEKGEEAVEKYKGFLKAGGSMYPIDTLKMAVVDMTTSKPLKDTLDRFNELLDMLEEII